MVTDGEEQEEEEGLTVIPVRGPLPAAVGKWASAIRVVEMTRGGNFKNKETFVVVGTAKDLNLHPKKWSSCSIHVYRLLDTTLTLLHQTDVEDIPMAMVEFNGRLLVGIGRSLRLFDLGKKKLLKKCENKLFPTAIVRLSTMGDRIYVGDLAESVLFVKYRRHENVLSIFADDSCPSGNAGVGTRLLWDHANSNGGAANKLELLNHYYMGELGSTGKEIILLSTITGGLIAFVPAKSKEEVYAARI
eukprot:gene28946-37972_t